MHSGNVVDDWILGLLGDNLRHDGGILLAGLDDCLDKRSNSLQGFLLGVSRHITYDSLEGDSPRTAHQYQRGRSR